MGAFPKREHCRYLERHGRLARRAGQNDRFSGVFDPIDHYLRKPDIPPGCTFAESDWRILAGFWHPVAFADDVGDAPVACTLLDVELVLFRTSRGVSAALDLCPHRGTRLSAGRIEDDVLVCPMHGFRFRHDGACVAIPSSGNPDARIPPRLRLGTVLTEERYGIVWACLSGEPSWPLPDWPGIGDPQLTKVRVPVDTWRAAGSRHVENFNDVAHFPYVHAASFGNPDPAPIADYTVDETDYGLTFALPYLEGGDRFPDGRNAESREVTYTYQLTFPFSTIIVIAPDGSDYVQYFADAASPVSARETRVFQVMTDTYGPDRTEAIREALQINDEDKPLVEGQRPERLPLDLREEIHVPADRMSVAYRRALARKFGLGAPMAA